ncbi:MAG: GNAT family N-acetyltransferase [Pseudomonadota bacterium]
MDLTAYVPELTTDRLRLRGPRLEDFEPYAAVMMSDRASHMDGPYSRRRAWSEFSAAAGQWLFFGHGSWSVIERATGDWIGEVSVNRPDHFPETEIGWMVTGRAEGRGFAREAVSEALTWVWAALRIASLVSYISRENDPSIRLAERLGAKFDPDAPRPVGDDCLVYRHNNKS